MEGQQRSYGAKECGSCRLWRPILEDARGPIGPCRLNVRTGDFPGTAPRCERHLPLDAAVPAVAPARVARRAPPAAAPVRHHAVAPAVALSPGAVPADLPEEILAMTREEFAEAIREALREETAPVTLAPKWEGGIMVLRPRDAQLQPKEIPLDQLFHKIVMIRDRLRVLEQRINAHDKLTDAEKVDLQSYVTRCYGTLTTFNVLFRDEKERFVGERGPV
jgi:hypothetical protein